MLLDREGDAGSTFFPSKRVPSSGNNSTSMAFAPSSSIATASTSLPHLHPLLRDHPRPRPAQWKPACTRAQYRLERRATRELPCVQHDRVYRALQLAGRGMTGVSAWARGARTEAVLAVVAILPRATLLLVDDFQLRGVVHDTPFFCPPSPALSFAAFPLIRSSSSSLSLVYHSLPARRLVLPFLSALPIRTPPPLPSSALATLCSPYPLRTLINPSRRSKLASLAGAPCLRGHDKLGGVSAAGGRLVGSEAGVLCAPHGCIAQTDVLAVSVAASPSSSRASVWTSRLPFESHLFFYLLRFDGRGLESLGVGAAAVREGRSRERRSLVLPFLRGVFFIGVGGSGATSRYGLS
ncbi:hypothetical protein C8J57DRAFT_1718802 [Mycena rebaudengoi]|nr:hypothetical protein C8J57DRAFT_1718802 [Mycena rebaudengoi]